MFLSFIVYILSQPEEVLIKGFNQNLWYLSLKNYICIIIVVSLNILINSHFISYLLPLSIGITTFLLFFIFLVLNHYGFLFNFNSKATIATSLSCPQIYLAIILITCFNFIFDYTAKLIRIYFNHSLSSKLILNKQTKKRKKSCSSNGKLNMSRYNNKSKVIEITSNCENEKSNNSLMPKVYNSTNRINLITSPNKNFLNLNYIPKIAKYQEGASYKNEFYSLNILKNISNKSINRDEKEKDEKDKDKE